MIHLDGKLITDDMAFTVTLILNGYSPEIDKNDKGAFWTVEENDLDEDIQDFINDWHKGRLRVEPRRFAREMRATRKDVYKLMGVEDQPRNKRVNRRVPSS